MGRGYRRMVRVGLLLWMDQLHWRFPRLLSAKSAQQLSFLHHRMDFLNRGIHDVFWWRHLRQGFDAYGTRYPLILGSFLHIFGLMMTSPSSEYYQFFPRTEHFQKWHIV